MPKTPANPRRSPITSTVMPAWASGRRRALPLPPRGPVRLWAIAALGLLAAAFLGTSEPRLANFAGPVTGEAERVIDGDTIDLAGQRIRLVGIDAPEHDQTCGTASGERWPCGEAARTRLAELVRSQTLTCRPQTYDRYGRLLARCETATGDLASQLVRDGLALATDGYVLEQADASLRHAGLWQGPFERPADWRRRDGSSGEPTGSPSRFDRVLAWLFRFAGS